MILHLFWRLCAVVVLFAAITPAHAERRFGSVAVYCDTFAYCIVSPEMPEPLGDPATFRFERDGKANAPIKVLVRVNKPVEGGVPVRLQFGERVFELQPGTDVLTEWLTDEDDGTKWLSGYRIAPSRVDEVIAAMRAVDTARLKVAVAGKNQERQMLLDGMDNALRWLDEIQGRTGAQDAVLDKGPREATGAALPKALPKKDAWPKEIMRIYQREKCGQMPFPFDPLSAGFIATPAPGHELWGIACNGGNYNTQYVMIGVRNGDMKTARLMLFPTRTSKRAAGEMINARWWDARKEVWAFHRGRSFGDCGTVSQHKWTERGFQLITERKKDDCDDKFEDPWTKWPEAKAKRKQR